MKTIVCFGAILIALILAGQLRAQTDTEFTFQGDLKSLGSPANGSFQMEFSLWDSAVLGSQIDSSINQTVQVSDGKFSVDLDFGAESFDNTGRWLEIKVRGNALDPRIKITRSPYSLQTRGIFVDDLENVGIGTTSPIAKLDVDGNVRADAVSIQQAPGGGALSIRSVGDQVRLDYGANGSAPVVDMSFPERNWRFFCDVGIGNPTQAPNANLHVTGSGADTVMRLTNGGNCSNMTNTALIIADVCGGGRAASLYGVTSNTLMTVQNDGSGDAARFAGDVTFLGGRVGVGAESANGKLTSTATSETAAYFVSNTSGMVGATTSSSAGRYGVFGQHPSGSSYGVWASGNMGASGTKSFRIDHPLEPADKYLLHYCTEAPEPLNAYSGTILLNGLGEAWVQLPNYFQSINRDLRYQLTCIGGHADVYIGREVDDNRFLIAGGVPGLKVSWEVTGVRDDAWVRHNGAPAEMEKPPEFQGLYLHPEFVGLSQEHAEHPLEATVFEDIE